MNNFKKNSSFLNILPLRIKERLEITENIRLSDIEEIRLKPEAPLFIYASKKEYLLSDERGDTIIVNKEDIESVLRNITGDSLYAHLDEIKKGFITVPGGHRVGLSGSMVSENGKILNITDISGINIRVAHEIKGISDGIIDRIYNNGDIRNTLIISPPGAGKTTLIRDIARNISSERMTKVVIIDERDEIAAVYKGIPQNDVGIRTFILSGYSKKDGFEQSLRSLSPTVIICDELSGEEIIWIKNAIGRGVKVIATAHGYSSESFDKNKEFLNLFDCVLVCRNGSFVEE